MAKFPQRVYDDLDLYPVIGGAELDLRRALASLLTEKASCSIGSRETDAAALVNELQRMGGNTVVNLARGSGVTYREIVLDAFEATDAAQPKTTSIVDYELEVVQKVLDTALDRLSGDQLSEVEAKLGEHVEIGPIVRSLHHIRDLPIEERARVVRMLVLKSIKDVREGFKPDSIDMSFVDRMVDPDPTGIPEVDLILLAPIVALVAIAGSIDGLRRTVNVFGTAYSVTIPAIALVHLMRIEQELR